MPQLQINQGPQDALLYDNNKSYFTNVGYVRTSNFQVEYRDVDAQTGTDFGQTARFVIPKAADLLGPVDLCIDLNAATGFTQANTQAWPTTTDTATNSVAFAQWVDELGFAMIEQMTFMVGSNEIEKLTGEQLQIKNELMTSDEMRLGHETIMKTGRPAFQDVGPTWGEFGIPAPGTDGEKEALQARLKARFPGSGRDFNRTICAIGKATTGPFSDAAIKNKKIFFRGGKLIVPLSFFFTKHVSQYFPLAAVAGCNDISISVKLRPVKDLIQLLGSHTAASTALYPGMPTFPGGKVMNTIKLRCHYVHVTGPEAQLLMNKEHVRLMKLYQHQQSFQALKGNDKKIDIDLSFLHPVSTLLITIRDDADLTRSDAKGYFYYHGDGTNPNYDEYQQSDTYSGTRQSYKRTVKVKSIKLTLNGQERHPGLADGIPLDYMNARLLPSLHSNSNASQKSECAVLGTVQQTHAHEYHLQGSKNIIVYPFSLNPEATNPAGAVNFSKVSHAKLQITLDTDDYNTTNFPNSVLDTNVGDSKSFRVDVHAMYYNWLAIKDGRALLSFA
ncbi:MAG: hypothetical protein CMO44_17375 [Verrucomicrobiales bacterium]|nr:hypothetical protein [Verrucomicrobiales bacterium]